MFTFAGAVRGEDAIGSSPFVTLAYITLVFSSTVTFVTLGVTFYNMLWADLLFKMKSEALRTVTPNI